MNCLQGFADIEQMLKAICKIRPLAPLLQHHTFFKSAEGISPLYISKSHLFAHQITLLVVFCALMLCSELHKGTVTSIGLVYSVVSHSTQGNAAVAKGSRAEGSAHRAFLKRANSEGKGLGSGKGHTDPTHVATGSVYSQCMQCA